MSVMQAMGLDNEQVLDLLVERWPQWCLEVPNLELLAEPAMIDAWRRAAPAAQVDRVLRGLAQLAATDGGDDVDAARVLAWLLMPVAVRLSAELVEFDPDIDEHIAACLWIEVRTARWQTAARLVPNLAWRLRRQVCIELGDRARIDTHRDRTLARTLIDDEIARTEHPGVDPYESTVRDELLAVLEWGRNQELITEADCVLANLNPFRGAEPDSGTCVEVGGGCGLEAMTTVPSGSRRNGATCTRPATSCSTCPSCWSSGASPSAGCSAGRAT